MRWIRETISRDVCFLMTDRVSSKFWGVQIELHLCYGYPGHENTAFQYQERQLGKVSVCSASPPTSVLGSHCYKYCQRVSLWSNNFKRVEMTWMFFLFNINQSVSIIKHWNWPITAFVWNVISCFDWCKGYHKNFKQFKSIIYPYSWSHSLDTSKPAELQLLSVVAVQACERDSFFLFKLSCT